jgi:homogentisate 1,2-dioxygenase
MINTSMTPSRKAFCNNDGDFLLCAQHGNLVLPPSLPSFHSLVLAHEHSLTPSQDIQTEFGRLYLQPGEIFIVQRGVRFSIDLAPGSSSARGYVTEVWGSSWELPDLGPIGGHGLANPRDFLFPVAFIDEELSVEYVISLPLSVLFLERGLKGTCNGANEK